MAAKQPIAKQPTGNAPNIFLGVSAMAIAATMLLWVIPAQTVPSIFASVSSGFYANFNAWILGASGLALTINGIFAPKKSIDWHVFMRTTLIFFVSLFLLVLLAYAMPIYGFLPVGALSVLGVLLMIGERRWWMLIMLSVLIPLIVWLLFDVLLGRSLP